VWVGEIPRAARPASDGCPGLCYFGLTGLFVCGLARYPGRCPGLWYFGLSGLWVLGLGVAPGVYDPGAGDAYTWPSFIRSTPSFSFSSSSSFSFFDIVLFITKLCSLSECSNVNVSCSQEWWPETGHHSSACTPSFSFSSSSSFSFFDIVLFITKQCSLFDYEDDNENRSA